MSKAEIHATLQGRAATYGLLARLLATELSEGLLNDLKRTEFPRDTGIESIDSGSRYITDYLAKMGDDVDGTKTELAVDFARLFVVRSKSTVGAAYPFESVYTSKEHRMMGDARSEVKAIYQTVGLGRDKNWNVGEDHVALELEFMQILAQRCNDALASEDTAQATSLLEQQLSFLERHLENWVPLFARDMERHAKTDFYRGVALFLAGWIGCEAETVEMLEAQLKRAQDAGATGQASDGTN